MNQAAVHCAPHFDRDHDAGDGGTRNQNIEIEPRPKAPKVSNYLAERAGR